MHLALVLEQKASAKQIHFLPILRAGLQVLSTTILSTVYRFCLALFAEFQEEVMSHIQAMFQNGIQGKLLSSTRAYLVQRQVSPVLATRHGTCPAGRDTCLCCFRHAQGLGPHPLDHVG